MSADVGLALSNIANALSKNEPHLAGGLSSHFSCLLKQVLQKVYGKTDVDDQGAFIRGKEFHKYIQGALPAGSKVGASWIIVGHEQLVRVDTEDFQGRGRLSPIDTLAWNLDTREFEIWDWKTTRVDLEYVKLDPNYEAQANLYAQARKAEWGLKYDPICRIITANSADWSVFKQFQFRSTSTLFAASMTKIRVVNQNTAQLQKVGIEKAPLETFRTLADGLDHWTQTQTPYRKDCRYCDFKERCVSLIKAKCSPDEIDTAEVVI